jgi:hypothetical protein
MRTVDKFPNTINDKYDGQHNQFLITVKHNGIVRRFSFYGSTADYNAGIKELTEADTQDAFKCFIDDSLYGLDTFEDFCGNCGYDTDSRTAERIYKLCQKSLAKAHDLGLSDDDLYNIVNDLNERS